MPRAFSSGAASISSYFFASPPNFADSTVAIAAVSVSVAVPGLAGAAAGLTVGVGVGFLMSSVLKLGIYVAVAVALAYSRTYLSLRELFHGEFFALTLFAMLGSTRR